MLDSLRSALIAAMFAVASITAPTIHVHLIGDSTMADRADPENPEHGWGQLLPRFFDESVVVHNHAVNGRSTTSFIDEGKWTSVLGELKPGDYLFIQFGHNDEKSEDSARYADARGAYHRNLERFVSEARTKGAVPILFTPIVRRKFNAHGALEDTHGAYPVVVRAVAKDLRVPLIDLQALTDTLVRSAGPEDSKRLYVWLGPGASKFFPEGRQDDTHLSAAGATAVARLAARELAQVGDPIGRHVRGID